jgi:hypothetical protein
MNIHEELFAKNFIVPEKRERYLSMLVSKKGRKKLISGFYHLSDLEEKYATEVPPNEQRAENIYEKLKAKGSPDICYVISTNDEFDGKELTLIDVLEEIVGSCEDGTFISCIAGKLEYYEGESMGARFIFEKIG